MEKNKFIFRKIIIAVIRFYQRRLSPLKRAATCKYYPTCSQYAAEAVSEWGVFVGGILAVSRILRCNPFSNGGINYPPRKKRPEDSIAFGSRVCISYRK